MRQAQAIEWSDVATRDEDMALARRCAAGDEIACRQLIDAHQQMVYALGFQLLGSHDEVLDLSQEVFLRVFRTVGRFQGRAALRTWIYRIVVNGARNRRRWCQRHRVDSVVQLDAHVEEHGEPAAPAGSASPELALDRKERGDRVWRALARLPLEQRSAIVLKELHGLRYAEVAYSLGVTKSAVKSRLARAREALRQELRTP